MSWLWSQVVAAPTPQLSGSCCLAAGFYCLCPISLRFYYCYCDQENVRQGSSMWRICNINHTLHMSRSKSANLYSDFFLLQFQQSSTITIIFRERVVVREAWIKRTQWLRTHESWWWGYEAVTRCDDQLHTVTAPHHLCEGMGIHCTTFKQGIQWIDASFTFSVMLSTGISMGIQIHITMTYERMDDLWLWIRSKKMTYSIA